MGVESKIWERCYPKHSCVKEKPEIPKRWPPHFSVNCFPHGGLSRAVLSGPDGLADYRAPVPLDKRPIGNYQFTGEGSYDSEYVWRLQPLLPVPGRTPVHLRPRSAFAGEVGWHASVCHDPFPSRTGHQILTSEFWRQSEDRGSHRYQDVWYPGPGQVGRAEQSGYFERFPSTPGWNQRPSRQRRAQTALPASRAHHTHASSSPFASAVSPPPPRTRTPSASHSLSQHSHSDQHSGQHVMVSVEPSSVEDCSNASLPATTTTTTTTAPPAPSHEPNGRNNSQKGGMLKSRHNQPVQKRQGAEESSSSGYTTYTRLPSPPPFESQP